MIIYKVLIADDEQYILEGLGLIIDWEEYGLEIVGEASDGIAALEILKTTKVHILVTDIKMPKMNGLELIRIVRNLYPEVKTVILSGYDDFAYLKEAINLGIENYLLKPVNETELSFTLLNIIEKIETKICRSINLNEYTSVIRDNLLCRLVSNTISELEVTDKIALLDINLDCSEYIICIIRLMNSKADRCITSTAAKNICNELLGAANQGLSFCDLNDDIVILFMSNELQREEVHSVISKCVCNINSILNLDVFATVGSSQNDFQHIYLSYNKAKYLLGYHLILPSNSIVDCEQVEKAALEREKSVSIDYGLLKQLLSARDKQAVLDYIVGIFKRVQQLKGVKPEDIQHVAAEMLFRLNDMVKSLRKGTNDFFESVKMEFLSVYEANGFRELIAYFESIISKSISFLCSEEETSSPMINQIYNYIQKNYSKDISLKLLSNKLNVNTAYLGQQFKKESGELFSDYLNHIRIEKAKELLSNTSLKTNEIAEKVGYIETNYFYRVFKKYTGISPSEFRRK